MKHIPTIPYLPVLDVLEIGSTEMLMETKALRLPIMTNNWPQEHPYIPMSSVSLAYTAEALYLRFCSYGKGIRITTLEDGNPVYKDSCMEAFVRIPAQEKRYINFEFNAAGVCDASRRTGRADATPLQQKEYQLIKRHASHPVAELVDNFGLVAKQLIVRIPFVLLNVQGEEDLPESLYANFYKCGDETVIPHFASWKEIETPTPDFHRPEFFAQLSLAPRTSL